MSRDYLIHLGPYAYRLSYVEDLPSRTRVDLTTRTIYVRASLVEEAMNSEDPNHIANLYFGLFRVVLSVVAFENAVPLDDPDIATLALGTTEMWGQITEGLAEWAMEGDALEVTDDTPEEMN